MNNDYSLNIILAGDHGVGKTTAVKYFIKRQMFSGEQIRATIGVNILKTETSIKGKTVTLMIYDISGQRSFLQMCRTIFPSGQGILYFYDVSNPQTLSSLEYWIQINKKNNKNNSKYKNMPAFVIGNKIDLKPEMRSRKNNLLEEIIGKNREDANIIGSAYTHALANNPEYENESYNVITAFNSLAEAIMSAE